MDTGKLKNKVIALLAKYKYVLLILVIGLIFMLIPTKKNDDASQEIIMNVPVHEVEHLDRTLANMLSMVDGAGDVQVLLTISKGQQTIYQTNVDSNSSTETVTLTDSQRNETGLVQQVNSPIYQGAVVLCQGADDPLVKLAITDAVSKVTGLGANQIAVLKMK